MKHETSSHTIKRTRVRIEDVPQNLGRFATLVGEHGARFGEISTVHIGKDHRVRDADIIAPDEAAFDGICDAIRQMEGIDLLEVKDVVHETHLHGKIEVVPRVAVRSINDLQLVYTPGVASICRQIQADPSLSYELTGIQNSVAIVTNGTAILGLGYVEISSSLQHAREHDTAPRGQQREDRQQERDVARCEEVAERHRHLGL